MLELDDDAVVRLLLDNLGQLVGSSVAAVLLVDSDGVLSVLTYRDLPQDSLQRAFQAFGSGAWSTSKPL